MSKLPVVSAKDLIRALERDGFQVLRQKGSHIVLQKRDEKQVATTVVPNHSEIARGTLRSILRQAHISPEHLIKLLTFILGITPILR